MVFLVLSFSRLFILFSVSFSFFVFHEKNLTYEVSFKIKNFFVFVIFFVLSQKIQIREHFCVHELFCIFHTFSNFMNTSKTPFQIFQKAIINGSNGQCSKGKPTN